jgi:hypothetical protein
MNFDLGDILSRAWRITWNNKILWLFGVLAALGNGGGGNFNTNFGSSSSRPSQSSSGSSLPPDVLRWLGELQRGSSTILAIIIAAICVLLLISLVVYLLSLLGQGGLIGGARLANAQGRVTFGEAWELARRYLGRLFLLNLPALLLGLVVVLIILGAVVAAFIGLNRTALDISPQNALGGAGGLLAIMACALPLLCVIVLAGVALRLLIFFARFAVVLEDQSPMAAYRRAWQVFKANFGAILILGLIFIFGGGLVSFIIALPLIAVIVPIVLGGLGFFATGQIASIAGGVIFALVCCAAYMPVLLVLQGVFETFTTSAWTLAYAQFIAPRPAVNPAVPYPYPSAPGGASA